MDNETAEAPLQNTINVTGNTFEDIQTAIDNAQENDTIQLDGDYKGSGKEITINKNIIIQGNSKTTLDAQSKSRIFNINSTNVTFLNLNFINAKTATNGGAIFSNGEVKIVNSTFKNNVIKAPDTWGISKANGGAVYADKLTIDNSEFISNSVTCNQLYYEDFVFGINIADGGAIYSKTILILTNSVFSNNRAGDGCAVFIKGGGKITNCRFDNNLVEEVSTICVYGDPVTIVDSNFTNNAIVIDALINLSLKGCNFINNSGTAVIFDYSIDDNLYLDVSNCNFKNNHGDFGGAILVSVEASVINSTFANNHADADGGAIVSYDKLYVYNCTFNANRAYQSGGAIKCRDADIRSSVFINNVVDDYYPSFGGGAIYADGVSNIHDCNFTKNQAALGGGILAKDFSGSSKVTVNDCKFTDNLQGAIVSLSPKIIIKDKGSSKSFEGKKALDNNLNAFTLIKSKITKLSSTTYMSGKKLTVTLKYADGKPVKRFQLQLKAVKGKTKKYLYADTNSKGVAQFKISTLPVGSYSLEVSSDDVFPCVKSTSKIKINKAKTIVKAKKVTNKFKKSKYFKVIVKNKVSKKPVKNVKIKIKVFTGKKYKTSTVKTNSKGVAKFNTKKLSKGKHKVLISSKNSNYKISAKSMIIIKK